MVRVAKRPQKKGEKAFERAGDDRRQKQVMMEVKRYLIFVFRFQFD